MESGPGSKSVPPQPGSIDKSKVLDVKPLRFLVPIFPNPSGGGPSVTAPFACVPPAGPFPSGVQPFYPFMVTNDSQHTSFGTDASLPGSFGVGNNVTAPAPTGSSRTRASQLNGGTGRYRAKRGGRGRRLRSAS